MSDVFEKCRQLDVIHELQAQNLFPFLREIEGTAGSRVQYKGQPLIMMGSNNYLGLTHDPRVIQAAHKALDTWGTGCTGSRFLNGNLSLHTQLEEELADFVGKPAALVFATGFQANQGAITAIVSEKDQVFLDKENHACILEGWKLSGAPMRVYRHCSPESLEQKLSTSNPSTGKMVITDGVFSMNGHIAPLVELQKVAQKYNTRLYVDDAHGLGVIGTGGRGTASHFSIEADLIMGTFSKSLASQGGFVAADKYVVDWVRVKARTFMFTAALAPASAASALEALRVLRATPELVDRLHQNARFLREGIQQLGLDTMGSQTPIIPILLGEDLLALRVSQELIKLGVFTTPVVYPASPKGQALIRMSLMATHQRDDLHRVIEALAKLVPMIKEHQEQASNNSSLYDRLATSEKVAT